MAGQADDAGVEGEVLAAELGPDPALAGQIHDLLFELRVAEGPAELVALGRQVVEIPRAGELHGLHRRLGRGPADDDRQVIRRACGRAQRTQLLVEERLQARGIEQGLGLLEQQRLVRRPAPLGDEQELVLSPAVAKMSIWAGRLVPELFSSYMSQRNGLGVAEVLLLIGLEDPSGEPLLVLDAPVQTCWPFLRDDRGRAGVLAHRQPKAGGDRGVAEQCQGHAPIVGRGLGVVEDGGDLREVRRAIEERDVAKSLSCQSRERLGRDLEDLLSLECRRRDELAVRRR